MALAVASLLAGCADLPTVQSEGCGNLVLNETEDCDGHTNTELGEQLSCGAPNTANACRYICDEANDVFCPTGWGCGTDGRCRRPSGVFEEGPGSPWRFRVDDFALGDVDGDGNADLVGNDFSSISVRYGSSTGEFPTETSLLTRPPEGPLSFRHFDDDNRLDVVVPIAGGLFVLLGQPNRSLEPVAYSPFEIDDTDISTRINIVPVESFSGNLNTELVMMANNFMVYLENFQESAVVLLPGGYNVNQLAGEVAVGNVHLNRRTGIDVSALNQQKGRNELVLSFLDASSVWVYTSAGAPPSEGAVADIRAVPLDTINLPLGAKVNRGSHLADVDGDGFLDVMVSITDGLGRPRIAVAYNDGTGNFDITARTESVFDRMTGDAPWPRAAGDLDGDFKADYIMGDAVFISDINDATNGIGTPTELTPTAFTAENWNEARIGDFNGDGYADFVTSIEGIDGIDIYLGGGIGFFNQFHVATDEPPRNLRTGDYDGDLIGDVAFVINGFGAEEDQLAVVFGSQDGGPSDPVTMGRMNFVEVMEPVSLVTSIDTIDMTSDLFVLSSSFPARETRAVAIMQGSSSRRMLSPFTLISESGGVTDPDIPRIALIGNFDGDSDDVQDIVSIAEASPDFGNVGPAGGGDIGDITVLEQHLWMVPGDKGDGSLQSSAANFVQMPATESFDPACASWAVGDLDSDDPSPRDEVVGIDNNYDCYGFGFSPSPRLLVARTTPGDTEPFSATVVDIPGVYRAVRDIMLHDLDGDGDKDLVALFTGDLSDDGNLTVEGAAVVVIWNSDGSLDPAGLSFVTIPDGQPIYDVAVAHVDTDEVPDLLILAERAVYVSHLDPVTTTYGAPVEKVGFGGYGKIDSGDVNGDGLIDIAFTSGTDVVVMLQLSGAPLGSEVAVDETTEGGE
jgi:hypothetical protein